MKPIRYRVVVRNRTTDELIAPVGIHLSEAEANTLNGRTIVLLDALRQKGMIAFAKPIHISTEREDAQ